MSINTNIRKESILIEKNLLIKRAILYLSFFCIFILISWVFLYNLPNRFLFFSFFPLLASLLTRIVTKDKSPLMIKPKFRENWRTYLKVAYTPGILIFASAVLFFLLFPNYLDLSTEKLIETYGPFGFPSNLPHTLQSILVIGIVGILISPFILPVIIFAFGEEIGWRGYFLPLLMKLMKKEKAILLSSTLWGLGHAPLIYFGFNYGSDYWLSPYSGILMMTVLCIVLGIWLSYVTIKSKSVIPASILHGSVNVIGEWPALVAIPGISTLLGPNLTGMIGMIGFVIVAIFLLKKLSVSAN